MPSAERANFVDNLRHWAPIDSSFDLIGGGRYRMHTDRCMISMKKKSDKKHDVSFVFI